MIARCPHYAGGNRRLCSVCYREDERALETALAWADIAARLRSMAGLSGAQA